MRASSLKCTLACLNTFCTKAPPAFCIAGREKRLQTASTHRTALSAFMLTMMLVVPSILPACNPAPPSDRQTDTSQPATPTLRLEWQLVTVENDMGNPETGITLLVNGRAVFIERALNVSEIAPGDYAHYAIPTHALLAAGGWWAGSGDYYYIDQTENELRVHHAVVDEMQPEGTGYEYRIIKTITLD